MKYLVSFLLYNVLLHTAKSITLKKQWKRWQENDITFGDVIYAKKPLSLIMCLTKCQETSNCISANMNEANSYCELSRYYPPDGTESAIPNTGWTVYYKESIEVQGVQAWQSSTYADCDADNAIDGIFYEFVCPTIFPCGCLCAHTNSQGSSWVMELKAPGFVKTVFPCFRVGSSTTVWRNTNFDIFVHNSFEDAKNGLYGTLCVSYTEAPITSEIRIPCARPIYGNALRIKDFKDSTVAIDAIQLCEVKVFIV